MVKKCLKQGLLNRDYRLPENLMAYGILASLEEMKVSANIRGDVNAFVF